MTESQFKDRLGILLIASHLGVILLVLALWLARGFSFDEMTTVVALISPMFAAVTASVVAYLRKERIWKTVKNQSTMRSAYLITTIGTVILFTLVIVTMVILKASSIGFADFEEFKKALAIAETIFGAYAGNLTHGLFVSHR